jgi:glutaminyl-peptide cyclotransferase
MANRDISWYPERPRRVILCSQYDTRPIADQEPDQRNWHQPFISANDGGSGVALLMELANHMKGFKTAVGVDFVLFDGEEYIFDPLPEGDKYFFGSEHFAQEYRRQHKDLCYIGAVLLDMVGGKNAAFPVEQSSWTKAEALVREIWGIAQELKVSAFKDQFSRTPISDDHIALNEAGIPTVDIIDFDYAHWHRLTDVPGNCAAQSLTQVAQVLTAWMQRQK